MSLSMYDASIPVLIRGLGIMSHYLDTAAAYAAEKNIPVSVLLQARLAPDMLPLARCTWPHFRRYGNHDR